MILRIPFLPYILIPLGLIGNEVYQIFFNTDVPYPKNQSAYAHLSSIAVGLLYGLFLRPRIL